jgi:hypothetical protein
VRAALPFGTSYYAGGAAAEKNVDAEDEPVWNLMAALAVSSTMAQQQILVQELKDKILENVFAAKEWAERTGSAGEGDLRIRNVNLLVSRDVRRLQAHLTERRGAAPRSQPRRHANYRLRRRLLTDGSISPWPQSIRYRSITQSKGGVHWRLLSGSPVRQEKERGVCVARCACCRGWMQRWRRCEGPAEQERGV